MLRTGPELFNPLRVGYSRAMAGPFDQRCGTNDARPLAVFVTGLLTLLGCTSNGDGDGDDWSRVTSLPGGLSWDSLSAADRNEVCSDVEDFYAEAMTDDHLGRLACARRAIDLGKLDYSFSQDSAAASSTCAEEFTACLAEGQSSSPSPLTADCDFDKYTACTFLIVEYEGCIATIADNAQADIEEFNCEAVDWTQANPNVVGTGQPKQCQSLVEKCP